LPAGRARSEDCPGAGPQNSPETFNPVIVDSTARWLPAEAIINYWPCWLVVGRQQRAFHAAAAHRELLAGADQQGPPASIPEALAFQTATCSSCGRAEAALDPALSSEGGLVSDPRPTKRRPSSRKSSGGRPDQGLRRYPDYASCFCPTTSSRTTTGVRQTGPSAGTLSCYTSSVRVWRPQSLRAGGTGRADAALRRVGRHQAQPDHPRVRVALTGKMIGFGVFDTLSILAPSSLRGSTGHYSGCDTTGHECQLCVNEDSPHRLAGGLAARDSGCAALRPVRAVTAEGSRFGWSTLLRRRRSKSVQVFHGNRKGNTENYQQTALARSR